MFSCSLLFKRFTLLIGYRNVYVGIVLIIWKQVKNISCLISPSCVLVMQIGCFRIVAISFGSVIIIRAKGEILHETGEDFHENNIKIKV